MHKIDIVKIRLVKDSKHEYRKDTFDNPKDVAAFVRKLLRSIDREVFGVINIDSSNKLNSVNFVSTGSLNSTLTHPREVFKSSILANAASVILFHNHPSGRVNYSHDDLEITKLLVKAGEILGIIVLDHVIVGDEEFLSFSEEGLLNNGGLRRLSGKIKK